MAMKSENGEMAERCPTGDSDKSVTLSASIFRSHIERPLNSIDASLP